MTHFVDTAQADFWAKKPARRKAKIYHLSLGEKRQTNQNYERVNRRAMTVDE
jgi:hypothetical protein